MKKFTTKIAIIIGFIIALTTVAEAQRVVVRLDSSGDAHGYVTPQALRTTAATKVSKGDSTLDAQGYVTPQALRNAFVSGTQLIPGADTVQITIAGLTTAGVLSVSYVNPVGLVQDTVAAYRLNTAGKVTLIGKNNYTVSYGVWKK